MFIKKYKDENDEIPKRNNLFLKLLMVLFYKYCFKQTITEEL